LVLDQSLLDALQEASDLSGLYDELLRVLPLLDHERKNVAL